MEDRISTKNSKKIINNSTQILPKLKNIDKSIIYNRQEIVASKFYAQIYKSKRNIKKKIEIHVRRIDSKEIFLEFLSILHLKMVKLLDQIKTESSTLKICQSCLIKPSTDMFNQIIQTKEIPNATEMLKR